MSTRQQDTGGNLNEDGEVVFVVRVRLPKAPGGRQELHGRAEHLKSHTTCYFKDCESLCEFLYRSVSDGGSA